MLVPSTTVCRRFEDANQIMQEVSSSSISEAQKHGQVIYSQPTFLAKRNGNKMIYVKERIKKKVQ